MSKKKKHKRKKYTKQTIGAIITSESVRKNESNKPVGDGSPSDPPVPDATHEPNNKKH